MQREPENWRVLCEEASKEEDPKRLLELVQQINLLLEQNEARFKNELWL